MGWGKEEFWASRLGAYETHAIAKTKKQSALIFAIMQDLKSNKEIYKIRDIISFGVKNARPRIMDTIEIFTQNRCEFVNITRLVESSLKKSAIRSGIGVIFWDRFLKPM